MAARLGLLPCFSMTACAWMPPSCWRRAGGHGSRPMTSRRRIDPVRGRCSGRMTVARSVAPSCFARRRLASLSAGFVAGGCVRRAGGGAACWSRPRRKPPSAVAYASTRAIRWTIRPVIVCDASCRWSTASAVVSSTWAESKNSTGCWLAGAAVCGEADGSPARDRCAATIQDSV